MAVPEAVTPAVGASSPRIARTRDGQASLTVAVLVLAAAAWFGLAATGQHAHKSVETARVNSVVAPAAGHDHRGTAPVATAPVATAPARPAPAPAAAPEAAEATTAGSAGAPAAAAPPPAVATGAFRWLGGWVVMVVAMMLPPALPLLRVVRRLARRRARPGLLVAACTGAFVAVWAAAGVGLLGVAALLDALTAQWVWLRAHPQVPSGAGAILAGAYQFTPLKTACLTACRSPAGIAMTTWSGRHRAATQAALVGARFGAVCVGCCWALMVLTLAVGVAALPVMVAGAVLMAAERLAPATRPLVPVIAGFALVAGALILVGALPPGLRIG